ncbi:GGDEF domain-containing protein [Aestuariivirga sp.]|uniref:GGDEF domain-containing protein n=1 Tax=Aestuariivirga sp. TaxID=2650926 RepID=UPI003593A73C
MPPFLRLILAACSGFAGLAALLLILRAGTIPNQQGWLLASVTVLIAAALFGSVADVLQGRIADGSDGNAPAATAADREVHGEVVKILGLLKNQEEASSSFSMALDKAKDQLPDSLSPGQVRLIVSYLMTENDKMRERSSQLQSSLERSQQQIEKLKSNLAAAEAQGLSDPLTGLKNRRSFDITIAAEIVAARSVSKPLSLVMADIDHFKAINDRYGHQSGDDVLKWFAKILSNNMKGRDTVARYGGEEFAILLPQTSLENAVVIAGQIRTQLEGQLWKKPGAPNTMLRVTASFGVAQLADGEGTRGLFERADAKLYESKAAGRNRVAA